MSKDKKTLEWTFNYYTKNARYALEYPHQRWPKIAVPYKVLAKRKPKERWEYCEQLFEENLQRFEDHFARIDARRAAGAKKRAAKVRKKQKRSIVRKLQLVKKI